MVAPTCAASPATIGRGRHRRPPARTRCRQRGPPGARRAMDPASERAGRRHASTISASGADRERDDGLVGADPHQLGVRGLRRAGHHAVPVRRGYAGSTRPESRHGPDACRSPRAWMRPARAHSRSESSGSPRRHVRCSITPSAATIAAISSAVASGVTPQRRARPPSTCSQRHVAVLALRELLALRAQHRQRPRRAPAASRADRSRRRRSRARPRCTGSRSAPCTPRSARRGAPPGRRRVSISLRKMMLTAPCGAHHRDLRRRPRETRGRHRSTWSS